MDQLDLYSAVGGPSMCRNIASAFYARVAHDPVLRPLFPGKTFKCAIDELSSFLAQFLGGPSKDAEHRWWVSLGESHQRFRIGELERAAWIDNMRAALDEVEISESLRSDLMEFFSDAARYIVNDGDRVDVTPRRDCPARSAVSAELARRWEDQRALDVAVAFVRRGDLKQARKMVESAALRRYFRSNQSVLAGFVAVLLSSSVADMREYAAELLRQNPDLVHATFNGRTLLHVAAGAGNLEVLEHLLASGADASVRDMSDHEPLYYAGNQCTTGGAPIVRALIAAGADPNANTGVQRCTALHMAARRDNMETAGQLLDLGADIEARDKVGDTPLRRAVNCSQLQVAALLLEHGADPDARGSKGLTPRTAARTASMRALFQA